MKNNINHQEHGQINKREEAKNTIKRHARKAIAPVLIATAIVT
jgi:hypothetical protein